jgi:MYXO-CTERM domain-containing protein
VQLPANNGSASNVYVTSATAGTVSVYDSATGALLDDGFIVGLHNPGNLIISEGDLLIVDAGGIGEYSAGTGAAIKSNFISVSGTIDGIAEQGSEIYVLHGSSGDEVVSTYNAATGTLIDANLIGDPPGSALIVNNNVLYIASTGAGQNYITEWNATSGAYIGEIFAPNAQSIAVSGNYVYVTYGTSSGDLNVYNLTTGALVSGYSITGLDDVTQMEVVGDVLYITEANGTVLEYDAQTGAFITSADSTLPSGEGITLGNDYYQHNGFPDGIPAASDPTTTPEPASWAFAVAVLAVFVLLRRRSRANQ